MGTASCEMTRIFGYSYWGIAVRSPICRTAATGATVELRTVDGRLVQRIAAVAGARLTLDLSRVEAGTYLLRLTGATGTHARSVVVRH